MEYTFEELVAIAALIVYIAVIWGIAIWARRFIKGMAEFYIGTRRVPVAMIALYGAAAMASGWTFVGQPGSTFQVGPVVCVIAIAAGMSFPISAWLYGWKMRYYSEKYGLITMPDLVEACYGGKLPRIIAAIGIILGSTFYLTAQYKAMGVLLGPLLHVPYHWAVVIGIIIYGVYVFLGGFMAAVYANVIQIAVMLIASFVIFFAGLAFVGGPSNLFSVIAQWEATQPARVFSLDMSACLLGAGIGMYISYIFTFALGGAGQPQVVTKMYALAKPEQLKWYAALSALSFTWVCTTLSFAGLFTRYAWAQGLISPEWVNMLKADVDYAIIWFTLHNLPPVLVGIFYAAVLAAVFTTSDGFLMMSSAGFARDIVHKCIKPDLTRKQEVLLARIFTLIIIIVAIAMVWVPPAIILVLGIWGWGTLAAVTLPAVAIGVNWKRVTKWPGALGILAGLVVAAGMGLLTLDPKVVPFAFGTLKYYQTFFLHPCIWGLLAATVVIVVGSLLTKPTPQNQGVIWTEAKGLAPPPPAASVEAEKKTLYEIAETFPTFKLLRHLFVTPSRSKE
jgi:Na+/proline symporter